MINLIANQKLKRMGCKWDGEEWVPPELAKNKYDEVINKFYSDFVNVEVTVKGRLSGLDWGYKHARLVAGYIVATASDRDGGAHIFDEVAVMNGTFDSGGSRKNFICDHTSDLVLRLKVAKGAIELLEEEQNEGIYTYKILDLPAQDEVKKQEETLESLIQKRDLLLIEVKKLEEKIDSLSV